MATFSTKLNLNHHRAAISLSNYLQARHLNQSCYEKLSACIIDVLEDGERIKHFDTNYCCTAHFTTSTFSCPQQFRSLRVIIPLGQTRYGDALKVWDSNERVGKVVECQPCRSKFDDIFVGPNRSNYSIPYGWQHDSIRGQRVDHPLQFDSINGPSRLTMPMVPAISIEAGQGNIRTNASRTGSFSLHDICQLHEGEEMLLKVAHLSLREESEFWGTSSEITYQQMMLDREHLNFHIFESEITIRRYSDNYLEYHFNADESGILQSTMIRQLLRSSSMLKYFNGHLQPGIRLALFDVLNGFLSCWLEFLTQLNEKCDLKISTTNSTDPVPLNQEVSILEQDFITNISRTLRDFIQAVDAVKREILSWPNVDVKTRAKLERSFVEIDTRITTAQSLMSDIQNSATRFNERAEVSTSQTREASFRQIGIVATVFLCLTFFCNLLSLGMKLHASHIRDLWLDWLSLGLLMVLAIMAYRATKVSSHLSIQRHSQLQSVRGGISSNRNYGSTGIEHG